MKYTEEEKKAVENIKEILSFNLRNPFLDDEADNIEILLNLLEKQQKEIKELKEDIEEYYKPTLDIFDEREYRKKYLEERRKEEPNLLYPDGDEIYKRYYEQKEIIKELQLNIKDLKSKTQIISPLYVKENYVPKEVIREKIKELKDNRPYLSKFDDWKEKEYTNEDINNMCVEVLEDLLGDE